MFGFGGIANLAKPSQLRLGIAPKFVWISSNYEWTSENPPKCEPGARLSGKHKRSIAQDGHELLLHERHIKLRWRIRSRGKASVRTTICNVLKFKMQGWREKYAAEYLTCSDLPSDGILIELPANESAYRAERRYACKQVGRPHLNSPMVGLRLCDRASLLSQIAACLIAFEATRPIANQSQFPLFGITRAR